jgi:CRISPR/Cas system-associated exonuclease Cas4 (RecB family)
LEITDLLAERAVEPSRTLERLRYKLSPASINSYYRCPRKFQFRYIRNVKMPYRFSPALAIGGVSHKVLAEIFRNRRDGLPEQPIDSLIERYIKLERYPKENGDDLRVEHSSIIASHVEQALDLLPDGAIVVEVERPFDYVFISSGLSDPVTIESRVDLVIRHGDGVVDHISIKTGSQSGDIIQNFISRVAVANSLDMPSAKLRTVNVLTKSAEYEVIPSDRKQHEHTWHLVKNTIIRLSVDTEWNPRPEPAVCRWCDFRPICKHAVPDATDGGFSDGY